MVGREQELEASDNPVAQIVLAHLEARATRGQPENRRAVKIRLVKGLYGRGWSAEDVRQLFRLIDWLMELPAELQEGFRQEIHEFEEAKHMPYVTSIERLAKKEGRLKGREEGRLEGREEGLLEGREEGREEGRQEGARDELLETIRAGLKDKFGAAGARLMSKVRAVGELSRLRALARALITVQSLEDFRDLLGDS